MSLYGKYTANNASGRLSRIITAGAVLKLLVRIRKMIRIAAIELQGDFLLRSQRFRTAAIFNMVIFRNSNSFIDLFLISLTHFRHPACTFTEIRSCVLHSRGLLSQSRDDSMSATKKRALSAIICINHSITNASIVPRFIIIFRTREPLSSS